MQNDILDLFQRLCKPLKDNLGGPKLEALTSSLEILE